jgi:hypothetical protein
MNIMNTESNDQQFIDLLAYNKVDMGRSHSGQNVIKSSHVVKNGIQEVSLPTTDSDEPTLLIHREGDQIVSVQFQCKCGRSTSVRLVYDEE